MNEEILTAVVTGGTAGVGRATAETFARAGYQVAIIARGRRRLDDTCAALAEIGPKTLGIAADVADADAVEQAAERIEAELGPIDVWINCAMVTVFGPISDVTPAEFRRVTEVTYLGFVHGSQSALRRMRPRDRGTIIQVGSALSYRAIPLQSAYCAAKFAIRGFTDALRCELIHDNSAIRVTMVQLPAHNTPQFDWARNKMRKCPQPVPPIHTPEVAARAILRAATDAPRELWLGGPSLQAIIGSLFIPGMLDRMMSRQAWDGQMTERDEAPERQDNLIDPVEDHDAGGRFGEQARDKAMGLSSETVRQLGALAAIAGIVIVIVATLVVAG